MSFPLFTIWRPHPLAAAASFLSPAAAFLTVCLLFPVPAGSATWSMNGPMPPINQNIGDPEHETSTVRIVFLGAIRFFQQWISPIDGPRCGFSPTCSSFGHQAVHDHGPVLGVLLTADRLLRCTPFTEPGSDYTVLPDGRLFDPVADNLLSTP